MYTAFLLDNPDSLFTYNRLFTGIDPPASDDAQGGDTGDAQGVGDGVIIPVDTVNNKKDDDGQQPAEDPAAAANGSNEARCLPCVPWTRLTRRNIHILNIAAAGLHAMLFIIIYWQSSSKDKKAWRLKQDRIQVVPKVVGDVNPFVKITNDKCNLAQPNVMTWQGSTMGALHLFTYPQVCTSHIFSANMHWRHAF